MKTIHKYPLAIEAELVVMLPVEAQILDVQFQRNDLCLWALVDREAAKEPITLRMLGTGHHVELKPDAQYLATVQQYGGTFVWHIFKDGKSQEEITQDDIHAMDPRTWP